MLKNLPAVQETWVQSRGGEDPLEKEIAAHSSILAGKIPWTGETGSQRVRPEGLSTDTQACVSSYSVAQTGRQDITDEVSFK